MCTTSSLQIKSLHGIHIPHRKPTVPLRYLPLPSGQVWHCAFPLGGHLVRYHQRMKFDKLKWMSTFFPYDPWILQWLCEQHAGFFNAEIPYVSAVIRLLAFHYNNNIDVASSQPNQTLWKQPWFPSYFLSKPAVHCAVITTCLTFRDWPAFRPLKWSP